MSESFESFGSSPRTPEQVARPAPESAAQSEPKPANKILGAFKSASQPKILPAKKPSLFMDDI